MAEFPTPLGPSTSMYCRTRTGWTDTTAQERMKKEGIFCSNRPLWRRNSFHTASRTRTVRQQWGPLRWMACVITWSGVHILLKTKDKLYLESMLLLFLPQLKRLPPAFHAFPIIVVKAVKCARFTHMPSGLDLTPKICHIFVTFGAPQ